MQTNNDSLNNTINFNELEELEEITVSIDKKEETNEELTVPYRHRFKWSHNEAERLHKEFDMKQYSIQEIADLHERTYSAILYKLKQEGLISINYPFTDATMKSFMDNYSDYMYKYCSQEGCDEDYNDDEEEDDADEDEDLEGNDEDYDKIIKFENYVPDNMDKYLFAYFNTLNTTFGYVGSVINTIRNTISYFF
jgi:hypothetical protein